MSFPLRLITCVLVLAPTGAAAEGYDPVLLGGRTASMGRAGIARGSDAAMPTLNPAGLALLAASTLSISANVYELERVVIPHYVAEGAVLGTPPTGPLALNQPGISSSALKTYPSAAAGMLHLGRGERHHVLALSLSTPRNEAQRFTQATEIQGNGVGYRFHSLIERRLTQYQVAASYALTLGPALRVGVSAILAHTQLADSMSLSELLLRGGRFSRVISSLQNSGYSTDVGGVAGAQLDLGALSFGLSVRTPSAHIASSLTGTNDSSAFSSAADPAEPQIVTGQLTGDFVDGFPLRIGVGAAYRIGDRITLALDAVAYLPRGAERVTRTRFDFASLPVGARPLEAVEERSVIPLRRVVNGALGGELRLTADKYIRLGAYTDFANQEAPSEQGLTLPLDRFGVTAGYGSQIGPIESTIGFGFLFGSGTTVQQGFVLGDRLGLPTGRRVEASSYAATVFVTGAIDETVSQKHEAARSDAEAAP